MEKQMKTLYILIAFLIFANHSHAVSRFDSILKEIIKYQEFEAGSEIEIHKLMSENKEICSPELKDGTEKHIKQRDEFIELLYNKAIHLQNNNISGSSFLEYILEHRLKHLVYRRTLSLEKNTTNFFNTPPEDNYL
jgi:hypothetical protein